MPIYQYRCAECNECTEAIQKVSDAPLLKCPSCGAEALKKLISAVGVIFSGSGFHKNDYTGTTAKKAAPATSDTGAAAKADAPAADTTTKTETASAPAASTSSDKPSSGGDGKVA